MDAKSLATADLVAAGIERHEAKWLLEEYGEFESPHLSEAVARRLAGEPLQYIFGHWPFRGLDLDIDARVLIPRPETEEMVSVILSELQNKNLTSPTILDLGCGSGAIGLSLFSELTMAGKEPRIVCVDISPDALNVAKANALKLGFFDIEFKESSWFTGIEPPLKGTFDLIVSNPPYVGGDEFQDLDPILLHEPRSAIVAPDFGATPGFSALRAIIESAAGWLTNQGVLICEHGDLQREASLKLALKSGFTKAFDLNDFAGKPRVLVARR